jgi:hypothetical protein
MKFQECRKYRREQFEEYRPTITENNAQRIEWKEFTNM